MIQALAFLWGLHSAAAELEVLKRILGFSTMQISYMVIIELGGFLPHKKGFFRKKEE